MCRCLVRHFSALSHRLISCTARGTPHERPSRACALQAEGRPYAARLRLVRRFTPLAAAFAVVTLGFSCATGAAESVQVRAGAHPTYGRLVLDWPAPIQVEQELRSGRLQLDFPRPMTANFGDAVTRLRDYLVSAELASEGHELILQLAPGIALDRLVQFEPDLVVLDFTAQDLEVATAERNVPIVRVGDHAGFTRVVFEFPGPVTHDITRDGPEVRLSFDRAASFDAVQLAARLRPFVDELASRREERAAVLRLRPGTNLVAFGLDGNKVVVDITRSAGLEEPAELVPAAFSKPARALLDETAPAPSAQAAARPALHREGSKERALANAPPSTGEREPERDEAGAGMAADGESQQGSSSGLIPDDQPATGAGDVVRAPSSVVPRFESSRSPEEIRLVFDWSEPVPAAVFARAGWLWIVFDRPTDLHDWPELDPSLAGLLGPVQQLRPETAGIGTVLRTELRARLTASVERNGGSWHVLLRPEPTPPHQVPLLRLTHPSGLLAEAAGSSSVVRVRDPVVGDMLDVWPILSAPKGLVERQRLVHADLLPTAQGLVVRPRTDATTVARVQQGLEIRSPEGLGVSFQDEPDEPGLGALRLEAGPLDIATPEVVRPDALAAGRPASPSGSDRSIKVSDDPRHGGSAVEDTPIELALSTAVPQSDPAQLPLDTAVLAEQGSDEPPVLGLAGLPDLVGGSMLEHRAELMQRLQAAPPEAKVAARLDLARFFLAHAMAAETLAVLESLGGAADPEINGPVETARLGVAGAAELLMGRLAAAEAALGSPQLDRDTEVALWRAAIAAGRNDWQAAARELDRSEDTLQSYPAALQVRLGLPAALIAIENEAQERAFAILDQLEDIDLLERDRTQVQFIRGLGYARLGDVDAALRLWRDLAQQADEETRVKAGFARATLLLDEEQISVHEALADLNGMRPLWRGHVWEAVMLDRLAQIQDDAGERRAAIRTWRELASRHPQAGRRLGTAQKISSTFMKAMNPDHLEGVEVLRALALYRDFPDLVPQGGSGREIRLRLAERLAEYDLVEPAAALLDELLETTPAGPARAENGALLAELRLRQAQPEEVLAVLQRSAGPDVTPAIEEERQLLRARALAASKRFNDALTVIDNRMDPAATDLRNAILWQQEDWQELVPSLERELAAVGAVGMTPDEQNVLIRLGIAYARAGRNEQLNRLREGSGSRMRGQGSEPAFIVATQPPTARPAPDVLIGHTVQQIAEIQTFLARSSRTE